MPSLLRDSLHDLMTAYVDGDQRAFAHLHRRVAPAMRRRLGSLVADRAVLDDILQSAFLRAHEARHRFDLEHSEDATVVAWYAAIARNTALDHLRRTSRRSRRELGNGHLVHASGYAPYAPRETPERGRMVREAIRERRLWVRAALRALSDTDRDLVLDHKLRGRTLAELARAQGVPAVTMRVRAHRAYRRLVHALHTGAWERDPARRTIELFGEPAAEHYDRGQWDTVSGSAAPWRFSYSPSA